MKNQRETVLRFLRRKYGNAPDISVYDTIDLARDWWCGRHEPFHVFIESGNGRGPVRREMYKMGMAKKICEDWAAMLVNDRTNLRYEDETVNRVLFGDRFGVGGILTRNNFWGHLNRMTEEAFALGCGAAVVQFGGTVCDRDGMLRSADRMELSFCSAEEMYPLQTENGDIVSCAFVGVAGNTVRGNTKNTDVPQVFLSVHEKCGDALWSVENILLALDGSDSGRVCPLPRGILKKFYSPMPLFATLTPNLVPADAMLRRVGFGASVFASAYDNLRGVDLAYNNFCRDLYLGGKKVFMNQNLVAEDSFGRRVAPDDVAQQLFVTVGDGDLSTDTMIVEHNPALRAEENARAVQAQLDYLSFKVGFGTRHYRFSGESVVTATQYAGDKQEMLQNAMKHYLHMEAFLGRLCDIARFYASVLRGFCLPDAGHLTVDFDDSFFIDPTAERERDLREVSMGILSRWEYRAKYYGESEVRAKEMLGDIVREGVNTSGGST